MDGAKKISAKQLKTSEGVDSSCSNALLSTCFHFTSLHSSFYWYLP